MIEQALRDLNPVPDPRADHDAKRAAADLERIIALPREQGRARAKPRHAHGRRLAVIGIASCIALALVLASAGYAEARGAPRWLTRLFRAVAGHTEVARPAAAPGDTVVVQVRVTEGDRERLQAYEGIVIAKRNRGLNSSFTVRKVSHGEGVERVFQTHSPAVAEIKVKRRGDVRRAKLYYLRDLSGKAARIKEKV